MSSVTADLALKLEFYEIRDLLLRQNGKKQDAIFSLSDNYISSKQMRYIVFSPVSEVANIVKKRARLNKKYK